MIAGGNARVMERHDIRIACHEWPPRLGIGKLLRHRGSWINQHESFGISAATIVGSLEIDLMQSAPRRARRDVMMQEMSQNRGTPPHTVFRALDSYEEVVWLASTSMSIPHTYVLTLEGLTDLPTWRMAWAALHDRYAILSARVSKQPGTRPVFVDHGHSSPIEIHAGAAVNLEDEAAKELNCGIDAREGLFRLVLFHEAERCAVLLTAHHAAVDGSSSILLLQDLLSLVFGAPSDCPASWLSRSAAFGRPVPTPYAEPRAPAAPDRVSAEPIPPIQVRRLALSAGDTASIIARTKREGATVHAALVVAAASVLASSRSDLATVRYASPIDLRELVGMTDTIGMLILNHVTSLEVASLGSFWEAARAVRLDVHGARTLDAAKRDLDLIDKVASTEGSTSEAKARFQAARYELLITNKGVPRIRTDYGELHVSGLWSVVCSGAPSTQVVSVLTSAGSLGLTQISRQPLKGLLDDMATLLRRV